MKWILPLFLSLLSAPSRAEVRNAEKPKIRFETVIRKDSAMGKAVLESFERVFSKLGFEFSAEEFPSNRGLQEMRKGRVDGTIGRVGQIAQLHGVKNYVRIGTPLMIYTVSLWCNKSSKDMTALKNPRVAYFPGNIFAKRAIQKIQDPSIAVSEIGSFANILKMLKNDRLDCLVASDTILDKDGIEVSALQLYHRHMLVAAPAFPWISKKYAFLVESLEKGLAAEPQEYDKKWRQLKEPGCSQEFNTICPDGRIFAEPSLLSDQEWRTELPWVNN